MEFNEGKIVTNVHVGQQKSHGLHVFSKSTIRSGTAILNKTKELQRKEAQITGNNSEFNASKLATNVYNDQLKQNKLNRIKSAIKPSIAPVNKSSVKNVASQQNTSSFKSKLNSVYQNKNK